MGNEKGDLKQIGGRSGNDKRWCRFMSYRNRK